MATKALVMHHSKKHISEQSVQSQESPTRGGHSTSISTYTSRVQALVKKEASAGCGTPPYGPCARIFVGAWWYA